MEPLRRILFAVKDPERPSQPGVDKAIHIAKQLGASLELFNAISTPVFLELQPLTGTSVAELRDEALASRRKRLEKLVARARRRGVKASCSVEWDYPPHEAIIRRAETCGADLIIAEYHEGKRLKPWLLRLTDWELLRNSRLPVLLLRSERRWRKPVVLAAVDPSHARDKPARLDTAIVVSPAGLGHGAERRGATRARVRQHHHRHDRRSVHASHLRRLPRRAQPGVHHTEVAYPDPGGLDVTG